MVFRRPKRAPSSEEPALVGLREALDRYPRMTVGAFARALGVTDNTVFGWLRGETPNMHHIELAHDFIEGRLVPLERGSHYWTLERADDAVRLERYRELMLAVGEVAAGRAKIDIAGSRVVIERLGPDGAPLVAETTLEDLTPVHTRRQDGGVLQATPPKDPAEKPHLVSFKLYSHEEELIEKLRERLGTTKTDVVRRGLAALAKLEGVE